MCILLIINNILPLLLFLGFWLIKEMSDEFFNLKIKALSNPRLFIKYFLTLKQAVVVLTKQ